MSAKESGIWVHKVGRILGSARYFRACVCVPRAREAFVHNALRVIKRSIQKLGKVVVFGLQMHVRSLPLGDGVTVPEMMVI
jgi:hypothetical protein